MTSGAYDYTSRMRFAVEVVRAVRQAGRERDFIIIYRLSMLDLRKMAARSTKRYNWRKPLKAAGASLIITGIRA